MVCTPNRSRNFSHTSARARVSESVEAREENEKHEEGGTHQACSRCRTRGAPRAACRPGSAGARGGTAGLRACSRRQPVVFPRFCGYAHRVTAQAETRRARGPCTRKTRDAPSPTYWTTLALLSRTSLQKVVAENLRPMTTVARAFHATPTARMAAVEWYCGRQGGRDGVSERALAEERGEGESETHERHGRVDAGVLAERVERRPDLRRGEGRSARERRRHGENGLGAP